MLTADLVIGRDYLYRMKRAPCSPHQRVKLLAKVGRGCKVKIRFIDGPFPGLEEYVHCARIIVPWGQSRAFLRDEKRLTRLQEISASQFSEVVSEAIMVVLAATGEKSGIVWGDGTFEGDLEDVRRIAGRAGITQPVESLGTEGFVDRFGRLRLSFDGALTLAMAYARAEPEPVLMYIGDEESELKAKGYEPGERYYHESLREQAPSFALARQWAGFEREVEQLRAEIDRLRDVAKRAAEILEHADRTSDAFHIRRALDGG